MLFRKTNHEARTEGRTVYRRRASEASEKRASAKKAHERGRVAPTLTPLLIGFALLLLLIVMLGVLSLRRLEGVNESVANAERSYADQLQVLLNLRGALMQLNNAARARYRSEARGFVPPLNADFRHAREDVQQRLPEFDRLPLAQTEKGKNFGRNVENYFEITDDETQFSLVGFEKFRAVEKAWNDLFQDAQREHDEVINANETLRESAAHAIETLTWLALLTGALVALGTILEAQRRFHELQRTLEAVRRERQFSAQILEGMVSAVAAIDADGKLRSANDAFRAIFPSVEIGKPLTFEAANNGQPNSDAATDAAKAETTRTAELAPEAVRLLQTALKMPAKRATYHGRWELPVARAPESTNSNLPLGAQLNSSNDGAKNSFDNSSNGLRTFDVYSSPLEIEGATGQILTLVDVTEAAQAENELRQQASLAAVGQATAQVAHEIKNPLGSIRLGVAMLRDMTENQQAISTIDLVERGIEHLNKLTVDVTQFSRRAQLELAPHDLHEILDASLQLVADKVQEKEIEVRKSYDRAPLIVECDEDQLRQVFVNLFANAIDASAKNSPLEISTETALAKNARNAPGETHPAKRVARITVKDYGAGMDEATRRRIFEPFFTTKKRGTGLGLAIVKKIIEEHGGRISVESAPNEGTKFVIDLPLPQSSEVV